MMGSGFYPICWRVYIMDAHAPGPLPTSPSDDSPIAVLAEEHALILRAVDLLEYGLARLEAGTSMGGPFFATLAEFFRAFADRYHHGKEEGILFPFMAEEMDYPQQSGPIAVLSSDHTAGRACVRAMAAAAARFEAEPAARSELLEHGRAYVALLRAHIDREDHKVFPTVDDFLGADERTSLAAAFSRFEMAEGGTRTAAHYADVVAALEREAGRPNFA
jgi:hemerythrin-like domain-containing protein